ncbi:MAG: hypothetical protein J6Q22_10380 [Prevotella sp.]|nr:hypothetical protein [Prevotella sp.]
MTYKIDNFNEVKDNILRFDNDGEFYMVLVLKRRKDTKGKMFEGANEDNRLIKHYFVYDKEYLDKKANAIMALCEQNNARAYILPQRRSCRLVLWSLHNKVSDTLKDGAMNVHFDHLIRSCVAGMHETEERCHKRWVIDIDADDEQTFKKAIAWRESHFNPTSDTFVVREYSSWIANRIRNALVSKNRNRTDEQKEFMPNVGAKYVQEDVTFLKTPHGFHIVTPPFNREPKAMEKYLGVGCPSVDWIKPDAMALLYAPALGKD